MLSSRSATSHPRLAGLRRLVGHSWGNKVLLLDALWRLIGLRAFLLIYGTQRQPRLYGRASKPEIGTAVNAAITLTAEQEDLARRVGWAIRRVEALLPFDVVCLPQALVGRRMLRNRGIASVMFFGVERNKPMAEVGTHAWLVAGPAKVTGFPQRARYNVFASYVP